MYIDISSDMIIITFCLWGAFFGGYITGRAHGKIKYGTKKTMQSNL